jgi:hypothetical protein
MTNTNSTNATHLSARIALQSASYHATRTVSRSRVDVSAASPMVASRMRWTRAILAATVGEKAERVAK